MRPKEEAEVIVQALFDELGTGGHCPRGCPYVDGQEAIIEMKEKGWNWKEVEWPGFYLKHKIRELVISRYPSDFEEYNQGKLYLVKGEHIWDTRFNVQQRGTWNHVPFMSTDNINKLIEECNGIGVLVVNAIANYDLGFAFYDWHEELKERPSDYTEQREAEGRPSRVRKIAFMITRVYAYYFPNDSIHQGVDEGWINPSFQSTARQQDGGLREGKYELLIDGIPLHHVLGVTNFNEDSEEWAAEFGE